MKTSGYRWVPLKPDFLGAWKYVWLKHYLAYPIIIISLIIQRNLATKIRAKWESGLTAVWLKWDPPVISMNLYHIVFCWGCQVWRIHLKMPELFCLQYDLPQVPHIQPWNTCQHQLKTVSHGIQKDHRPVCPKVWCTLNHSSNSQMAVW